jgi:hypothetical protein
MYVNSRRIPVRHWPFLARNGIYNARPLDLVFIIEAWTAIGPKTPIYHWPGAVDE